MTDSGLMVSSVEQSPALGRALSVGIHGPLDTCAPVNLLELSVWYLCSTTITVVWPLPSSFCDLSKPLSWPSELHPQAVFLPDLWLFSSSPSVVPEVFSIPPPPFLDSVTPNSHRVDCIRGPQVPVFVGSSSHFLVMCDDFPVALGPEATSLQLTRTLVFCLLTTPTSWASRPLFFTWFFTPPSFLLLLSLSMQS